MIFSRYVSPDDFEFFNRHAMVGKNESMDEAISLIRTAMQRMVTGMDERKSHGIKRIAEAFQKKRSIFHLAVERGAIDANSEHVRKYVEADQEVFNAMDEFHRELLQGG